MFDNNSRYSREKQLAIKDRRGRKVLVVTVPSAPEQNLAGLHLLRQGQRIDHLAAEYLNQPTGYWRIAEINGVMLPEALTEKNEISIPAK